MWILALLLVLAVAPRADADSIVRVTVDQLVFNYPGTSGADEGMPQTYQQTAMLTGSLQWDNTTRQLVPGTVDFFAQRMPRGLQGPAGPDAAWPSPFALTGVGVVKDQLTLRWWTWPTSGTFDTLNVVFPAPAGVLEPGDYPITNSVYNCWDSGHCLYPVYASSGTQSISTVPEPSTLLLMVVGLGAVWVAVRRRVGQN
jgi:hypothetical protein